METQSCLPRSAYDPVTSQPLVDTQNPPCFYHFSASLHCVLPQVQVIAPFLRNVASLLRMKAKYSSSPHPVFPGPFAVWASHHPAHRPLLRSFQPQVLCISCHFCWKHASLLFRRARTVSTLPAIAPTCLVVLPWQFSETLSQNFKRLGI